ASVRAARRASRSMTAIGSPPRRERPAVALHDVAVLADWPQVRQAVRAASDQRLHVVNGLLRIAAEPTAVAPVGHLGGKLVIADGQNRCGKLANSIAAALLASAIRGFGLVEPPAVWQFRPSRSCARPQAV